MNFNQLFKEYFYIGSLPESEQKEYYLIERYSNKVSERLLNRQKQLWEEGKEENARILSEIIKAPNPFLKMMSKYEGHHYPIPIIGVDDES